MLPQPDLGSLLLANDARNPADHTKMGKVGGLTLHPRHTQGQSINPPQYICPYPGMTPKRSILTRHERCLAFPCLMAGRCSYRPPSCEVERQGIWAGSMQAVLRCDQQITAFGSCLVVFSLPNCPNRQSRRFALPT